MKPVPSNLTKTYPPRGPLQQFRFAAPTTFKCCRCGKPKKSKLISVYEQNWSRRLCNACYGCLLSVHRVKAGTEAEDERAEKLAVALLSIIEVESRRQAEFTYRNMEKRAECLSPEAVRFIATAEHVAKQLQSEPELEWSPAVIGLCKAVESEIVSRILIPLAHTVGGADLASDKKDEDIGRVAAFCADTTRKPPELGAFTHFLRTAIHSRRRRDASATIGGFMRLASQWAGSNWILDPDYLLRSLDTLRTSFRNRAAHIDELGEQDYTGCRDVTIGKEGIVWRLVAATE